MALALLPVADGVEGHVDPLGELCLTETQATADAPRESCGIAQRIGIVLGHLSVDLGLAGGVQTAHIDAADRLGLGALHLNRLADGLHTAAPRGGWPCGPR